MFIIIFLIILFFTLFITAIITINKVKLEDIRYYTYIKGEEPLPPPSRFMQTGIFGSETETKESIQSTKNWIEYNKKFNEDIKNEKN